MFTVTLHPAKSKHKEEKGEETLLLTLDLVAA
jgi:hypothetical protein